jgi:hypothetical protein
MKPFSAEPVKQFQFNQKYGWLYNFEFVDNDTIIAGFSQGVICLVSIKDETCGHEIKAITVGSASIDKINVCKEVGKAAIAIQGCIKFIDLDTMTEVTSDRIELT